MTVAPGLPVAVTKWLSDLYRLHWESVCAHIRRKYGPGPPDPEDVAQLAFVRLARLEWSAVEKISHPKSFLFRMAENISVDEKRRQIIRTRHAVETIGTSQPGDGSDPSAESVLVTREDLSLVEKAIRAMPERRRQCFLLHRMEELSCAEIGRRLGISGTAVRMHVERGLKDVQDTVEGRLQP